MSVPDGSVPGYDAGGLVGGLDSGAGYPDVGTVPSDAGEAPEDSGSVMPDAGDLGGLLGGLFGGGMGDAGTSDAGTGSTSDAGTRPPGDPSKGELDPNGAVNPQLPPKANNPAECPSLAPPNPVGNCLGLPIYVVCGYGAEGSGPQYTCTCDWYHWLCI